MSRLSQSVAMGVGASGAMTDVSSYVDLKAGVQRSWGRNSEFGYAAPGTFSFVLDNADGRFTPGNTSSPLATTVTEGMPVCWQLGSRLVSGTVQGIEPTFPSGESAWAQVRVTCDDMLGAAARHQIDTNLADSITQGAGEFAMFLMDEPEGSIIANERYNRVNPLWLNVNRLSSAFGQTNVVGLPGTGVALRANSGTGADQMVGGTQIPGAPSFEYGTTSMGYWGCWVTSIANASFSISIAYAGIDIGGATFSFGYQLSTNQFFVYAGTDTTGVYTPTSTGPFFMSMGIDTTLSAGVWTIVATLYLNGTAVVTSTYPGTPPSYASVTSLTTAQRQPTGIQVVGLQTSAATTSATVSRLSHTLRLSREERAIATTEAGQLTAWATVAPEITLDTLPAGLSDRPLGFPDSSGSLLDALNQTISTEQGHIYTVTSGTLTSPTQKVKVRERDRTASVAYTFNAETEGQGEVPFVRDITDLLSTVVVTGPDAVAVYTDPTLSSRAQSSNGSETVSLSSNVDLYTWGTDRVWRGANVRLRVGELHIDAFTTPTDRSSDLLAMVPGDRIRVSGLPSTQLGFSTWDGWLIGGQEDHNLSEHSFTLYLQPALPDTAIFDTNYLMVDGALTLSSAISSSGATTMSVSTTGPKLETSAVPYDLLVDSEQVTVTACTSANPQVATITRGVNGTTATTHTTSAVIEIPTPSLYAF